MAVVIVNEMAGADQGVYDDVTSKTIPGGQLPDGCQVHIASPIDNGWRVITVWDSEEQFEDFRHRTLVPAMQETGHADRVAPKIDARPIYRLITS